MLEKIAVCGREIVTWTAGSVKGRRGRGHVGLIGARAEGETITRNCRFGLLRNSRTGVVGQVGVCYCCVIGRGIGGALEAPVPVNSIPPSVLRPATPISTGKINRRGYEPGALLVA